MKSRSEVILIALGVGIIVTGLTTGLSYLAFRLYAPLASEILFWPHALVRRLILPAFLLPDSDTAGHLLYKARIARLAGLFVSLAFGVLVYSGVAYLFLRRRHYSVKTA